MSLKDEREIMIKIHEKPSEGSKFIIEPDLELTEISGVDCIMTPYYGLTTQKAMATWKGDEEKIKRFAKGLCLGLKHMHDLGFAHRDIKESNTLMQNKDGDPVIIDFGLVNAKTIGSGTTAYLAPEQRKLEKGPFTQRKEWWFLNGFDQRLLDSFSLGVVLSNCFKGYGEPSKLAQEFIDGLKHPLVDHRMQIEAALKHKWIAGGAHETLLFGEV